MDLISCLLLARSGHRHAFGQCVKPVEDDVDLRPGRFAGVCLPAPGNPDKRPRVGNRVLGRSRPNTLDQGNRLTQGFERCQIKPNREQHII